MLDLYVLQVPIPNEMKTFNKCLLKTWQFTPTDNPAGRDLVKVEKILLKCKGRVILL